MPLALSRVLPALPLLLAAACGPATPAPGAAVSFMVFGDPAEHAAYQSLVAAFETEHPAIDIALIHIPGQSDYRQRLAADFAAGTPADVVLVNYRRYAELAAAGALTPLGPYLDRSTVISPADFFPEAIEPFRWEGVVTCIPQNLSSLVVYYNQDLFDAAGVPEPKAPYGYPAADWTWADFLRTAQALTLDTDGDGRTDQFGLGTEASLFRAAPFIWQAGGDVVDSRDKPTRLALDTPEAERALQWFVELQTVHHVVPSRVEEEAESSENRFLNGRTAMFLNSRRGVPTYREIEGFRWDVAALPHDSQRAGILHADGFCLAAAAQQKDAAWTFIEYANSPAGQTILAATGRTVPSLRSVAQSPAFLDSSQRPANSAAFLDGIPTIRAAPIMATWVQIENRAGEEIERAFYGEATLAEAIAAAQSRTLQYFEP